MPPKKNLKASFIFQQAPPSYILREHFNDMSLDLKNKKILLVGLGILGGGESLAKFLLLQKAKLTITDLRKRKILLPVIKRLRKEKIKYVLGKHREEDFKKNDLIVFNPAVSVFSFWAKLARKYGKSAENDLTLFLEFFEAKNPNAEYIAITGTRGKTTTSLWLNHFLGGSVLGGNMPNRGLFSVIRKRASLFILELSSFQLEFLKKRAKPPKIAVITNLYNDHLNRYGSFKKYLEQKAKIFLNQGKDDFLILNADNKFTKEFLTRKPKAVVYYFSLKKLPIGKRGLYFLGNSIYFKESARRSKIGEVKNLAPHQKNNLSAALLSAHLCGKPWKELIKKIKSLPQPLFRQEIIFTNSRLEVVNDSAGTSPDGTIAALERFGRKDNLLLITGGTDKALDFSHLAKKIKLCVKPKDLFLLEGSATRKLVDELNKIGYYKNEEEELKVFHSLGAIVSNLMKRKSLRGTLLFSPASASFEKFKNEFDRGRQFNRIIFRNFKK